MEVVQMTIDDYDMVYTLWRNTPGMGLNTIDDSREGIKRYLKRNPTTCFVAKENKKVVGAILSGHDGRRGYIYHTAVEQTKRQEGIGAMLVGRALEALKAEEIHKVALVAFKKNELGNTFWEHMGFSVREDLSYRNQSFIELKRIDG